MSTSPSSETPIRGLIRSVASHAALLLIGALLATVVLDVARLAFPGSTQGNHSFEELAQVGANGSSLVLALHPTCTYCEKGMEFYRPLLVAARNSGIHLNAVSTAPLSVMSQYTKDNGLSFDALSRLESPNSSFVTPALSLLDEQGDVIREWRGLMTPKEQRELIRILGLEESYMAATSGRPRGSRRSTSLNNDEVDAKRLSAAIAQGDAVLIDTRSREAYRRSHAVGAINMPLDELEVLAPAELEKSKKVVIYCEYEELCAPSIKAEYSSTYCSYARGLLRDLGYRDVQVIDEGQMNFGKQAGDEDSSNGSFSSSR